MFTKTDRLSWAVATVYVSEDSSCEPAMIVVVVGVEGNVGGGQFQRQGQSETPTLLESLPSHQNSEPVEAEA